MFPLYLYGPEKLSFAQGGLKFGDRALPVEMADDIVILPPATFSGLAIRALAQMGKRVVLLNETGGFLADLAPPGHEPASLLAQCDAARTPTVAARIATDLVRGRILGIERSLQRAARSGYDAAALSPVRETLRAYENRLHDSLTIEEARIVEAHASAAYWRAFGLLTDHPWRERSRRPPADLPNAALSFLGVLWTVRCAGALRAAGLDPRIGFLHALRPGRDSLACDLVEEFRAPYVEREVLGLLNRGQLKASHARPLLQGGVHLTEEGRAIVLAAHARRLRTEIRLPNRTSPLPVAALPLHQARVLAQALRNGDGYAPFLAP